MAYRILPVVVVFFALSVTLSAEDVRLVPTQRDIHDLELRDLGAGEWEVRTTGTDPYFYVDLEGEPDLQATPMLAFETFSTTGVGRLLVFVGQILDIPRLIEYHAVSRTEGWVGHAIDLSATREPPPLPVKQLRITMGQHPGNSVRIRNLRLRTPLPHENEEKMTRQHRLREDTEHAIRIEKYLERKFDTEIISVVRTGDDNIIVSGKVPMERNTPADLIEVPMWKDVTSLAGDEVRHAVAPDAEGRFRFECPRFSEDNVDRLLVGWAIVGSKNQPPVLLSPLRYADVIEARSKLPPARPRSLKGIGGCPFEHPDMQELGIASVTLNIILSDLFFMEPGPELEPFEYAGRIWHVNKIRLAEYDRQMRLAAENGWMVSAIILIPPGRYAPEGSWHRRVSHPEADPGAAFAMPNFTTREGAEAFAAGMFFLTERYSREDGAPGRVHHWIMHNEINSGFYWTSAGGKDIATYLNLYQKSLRTAQSLARCYDPHAKALISLEHCWTAVSDPRAYPAKGLLELLVRFSRREGDFEWGIAFHPYPQDIANPRTWEDSQALPDADTPLLTYRNLEVLDAWVHRPEVTFQGRPREIQLTEQGLNSPDYSEKSLLDQAAGMAYAWKKLQGLSAVTAFQYHLWADAREEGGLKLGLRKYGDDPDDPHGKKPIWHLFKALATPDEDAACEFAQPIITTGR